MNKVAVFNITVVVLIEKAESILITKRSDTRDHAPLNIKEQEKNNEGNITSVEKRHTFLLSC